MAELNLKDYICNIPDFPKPGIIFRDVTTLIQDPKAFGESCRLLAEAARELKPDCIAAPEARGFLFAAPVALELGCRLALIRKPKKLPRASISETYALEYGTDTIAIHEDAIPAGSRVLILDDLLATGGTVAACRKLVERLGSTVVGYGFLIELSSECNGRKVLEADGTAKVFSIIDY